MKDIQNRDLFLGKQGENNAVRITFDLNDLKNSYGEGTITLIHRRRPDKNPYPVALEIDGNTATWVVSNTDTEHSGNGQAELIYVVDNVVVKSQTMNTRVEASLGSNLKDGVL